VKPIIFLDFDGVLNAFDEPRILSEKCVSAFNYLLEQTDADVVVSSTWRVLRSIEELRLILETAGFKYPERIIGVTPIAYKDRKKLNILLGVRRGREIEAWLKEHPKVKNFVILDDDTDMEPFMDRLIKINSDKGLTLRNVKKVLKLLGEFKKE